MSDFNNPWDTNNKNPSKKPDSPDDLDAMVRKGQETIIKFLNINNSGKNNKKMSEKDQNTRSIKFFLYAFIIFTVCWLFTGFYTVQPDEEGVVLRLGKYNRTSMPGLNYKFPAPIETVIKVSTTRVHQEIIGFRPTGAYETGSLRVLKAKESDEQDQNIQNISKESQMLTEDENIIDINFDVQWRVKDARDYLFNVRDLSSGENTVKSCAESSMREVIGMQKASDALAQERLKIEQKAQLLLQDMLNKYNMGIQIERLQMLRVQPPVEVIDSYRDVQSAKADKEKLINQALAYKNAILPQARGEAEKYIQAAEGHKTEVIANAQGTSQQFSLIYDEYQKAKEVTRKKMYIETMQDVLGEIDKIIIDNKVANATIPYLPLNELLPKHQQE